MYLLDDVYMYIGSSPDDESDDTTNDKSNNNSNSSNNSSMFPRANSLNNMNQFDDKHKNTNSLIYKYVFLLLYDYLQYNCIIYLVYIILLCFIMYYCT